MDRWLIAAIVGVFSSIVTIVIWVAAHVGSKKRHPHADKVVYKDTCESDREGMKNCLEGEVKVFNEKIKAVREKIDLHHEFNKGQFAEIKQLIQQSRS